MTHVAGTSPRHLIRPRAAPCLLGALLCSLWQVVAVLRSSEDVRDSLRSSGVQLSWRELGLWLFWTSVTTLGPRRVLPLVKFLLPQYHNTVFYYPAGASPGVTGLVALTIDDGICRQNASHSMLVEVLALLRNHSAHATFFLNSDYLHQGDLVNLVHSGHELANHLPEDRFGYAELKSPEFQAEFLQTDAVLAPYLQDGHRWFRAPQGRLTRAMAGVLQSLNVTHALGDSYADDWAIGDSALVASLYLRQVDSGSVVIMHMPERGFREHTLETMRFVLQGLQARGLTAVTLGQLARAAAAGGTGGEELHGKLRGARSKTGAGAPPLPAHGTSSP